MRQNAFQRKCLLILLASQQALGTLAFADGLFDRLKAGRHAQTKQEYHTKTIHHTPPYNLSQIASLTDVVEEGVLDDGTIVLKRPDIWSQARMTKYRREFEDEMKTEVSQFKSVISARVARSDQATFESATSLGAALSSTRPGSNGTTVVTPPAAANPSKEILEAQSALVKAQAEADKTRLEAQTKLNESQSKLITAETAQTKLNTESLGVQTSVTSVQTKSAEPFKLLDAAGAFQKIGSNLGDGKLGLEPTIYLDEKKRYLDHLNELRRVNLGDDNADSAGYAMTLVRMPVSIQPGEKTKQGHGAIISVTARPEFRVDFLQSTFRNLVIHDIVDQFAPILHEVLDRGLDTAYAELVSQETALGKASEDQAKDLKAAENALTVAQSELDAIDASINSVKKSVAENDRKLDQAAATISTKLEITDDREILAEALKSGNIIQIPAQEIVDSITRKARGRQSSSVHMPDTGNDVLRRFQIDGLRDLGSRMGFQELDEPDDTVLVTPPMPTVEDQKAVAEVVKAVEPIRSNKSDLLEIESRKEEQRKSLEDDRNARVQIVSNLKHNRDSKLRALSNTQDNLKTTRTKINAIVTSRVPASRLASRPYPIAPKDMTDVFLSDNFLNLAQMIRRSQSTRTMRAIEVRSLISQTLEPAYNLLPAYEAMIDEIAFAIKSHDNSRIPRLYDRLSQLLPNDLRGRTADPLTIMSWAIAVDAGLLDMRLKEEMTRLNGQNNFTVSCDLDSTFFYFSQPQPEATAVFQSYVNARWPIICFALDPVIDQQNVADAFSSRRDLQLAVSFAFATGQINFNQFNRFRRRLEYDAETIALNQTVTTFAHGNESFGWRFYPRFQNPPQEGSNVQVIANQLWRGGPSRDYQSKHSKLEPGQRELTAVLIVPSFLTRLKFQVEGNWFPLTQPDDHVVPTARMIWQGQEVQKLRHAATQLCDPRDTRPGDVERVLAKIDRVEQMLPMQTEAVSVPFENSQGGFDLFTPGLSSLVPELFGYDGIDLAEPGQGVSFLVFGRNLSIHETKIVAGGRKLEEASAELLSREVMRITVPDGVLPTILTERDDRTFIEIVASTPNGISNRLVIPIKPKEKEKAATTKSSGTGYTWSTPPAYNAFAQYNQAGRLVPIDSKSPGLLFQETPDAEVIVNANRSLAANDDSSPPWIPTNITHMAMRLKFKDQDDKDVVLDTKTTRPNAAFTGDGATTKASIPVEANIHQPIRAALSQRLQETRFPAEIPISVETYILVEGSSASIKLDSPFSLIVRRRETTPALILPPAIPEPIPAGTPLPK